MRFSDIRVVETKLFEANRGIIGTVLDTQAGKGASFTKPDGTIVQAVDARKFPVEENQLRYEPQDDIETDPADNGSTVGSATITPDKQFEQELQDTLKMKPTDIKWVGGQKPSTGFAALVVELRSEKGKEWVGKYFRAKNNAKHIFWQVTEFVRDCKSVGIDLDLKRAKNSTGVDSTVVFGPREVGVTDRVIQIDNLIQEVRQGVNGKASIPAPEQTTLPELLENLGGATTTINPDYKANYEVQFGEVAAPLAITKGINVSGSLLDAEKQLLGLLDPGTKWTSIQQVEFPENIAERLVDSYLITPNGSRIGVSSKDGKGGAAASISSITDTMENKMDTIESRVPTFKTRYAQYIEWLDTVKASTGKSVAYNLAAKMGIITEEVANEAYELMTTDPGNEEALKAIDNGSFYDLTINYPGYNPNFSHSMYRVSYHAVASLARMVAAKFNEDKQKVYEFFATVLESSNMIQVMAKLTAKGDQASFTNFNVIYPPVFDGDIKLEAGSYFYAQRPPAGFTFKIK